MLDSTIRRDMRFFDMELRRRSKFLFIWYWRKVVWMVRVVWRVTRRFLYFRFSIFIWRGKEKRVKVVLCVGVV